MTSITEQAIGLAVVRTPAGAARFHQPIGSTIKFETGRMKTRHLPPPRALSPRKYDQAELVEDARRHGIQHPIALRHNSGGLIMANGEHRADAARQAGLEDVPVIVQHAEGVNPDSLPIQNRQPASLADWERIWNQKPPETIAASITDQAGIELTGGWRDAWRHERRGPHGEWVSALDPFYNEVPEMHGTSRGKGSFGSAGSGRERDDAARLAAFRAAQTPKSQYAHPDHARLFNHRSPYHDPADHPWFAGKTPDAKNVMVVYYDSSPEQVQQGLRWYQDAQEVAKALGNGDVRKGAGILAAYSPQTAWTVNMMNAARAFEQGRAIGPGEGMITGAMQRAAQRIMDGEDPDTVLKSPKVNAFYHLIANGADDPSDSLGRVVVDRHAVSVAIGHRVTKAEMDNAPIDDARFYQHVADAYREAALAISQKEGRTITPHQLQAITWLRQQERNQGEDSALGHSGHADVSGETTQARLGRGRETSTQKAEEAWNEYAIQHPEIPVHEGTTRFRVASPITADEARGNSRPVTAAEFQHLAGQGRAALRVMRKNKSPITGLDRNWGGVKDEAWAEVQKEWGGATFDSHTGKALPQGADRYALSVKPAGLQTISVPEGGSREVFDAAMDRARVAFRDQLENGQSHLGVFHDDENNRVDIDPVTVVDSAAEAEQIGAYTHAIGGAYHFATGDGYFPPHVAAGAQLANESATGHRWTGPGQWRSNADQVQPGLSPEQLAEIERDDDGDDTEPSAEDDAEPPSYVLSSISSQVLDLAGRHVRTAAGAALYHEPIGALIIKHDYAGQVGSKNHITRTETGRLPTSAIAHLKGVSGEKPGEHTTRGGPEFESLKADVARNGVQQPIFITVDHGEEPKISEGNNRRDAAVATGQQTVPVEIRYFGHAEQQGSVAERAADATAPHDFNEEPVDVQLRSANGAILREWRKAQGSEKTADHLNKAGTYMTAAIFDDDDPERKKNLNGAAGELTMAAIAAEVAIKDGVNLDKGTPERYRLMARNISKMAEAASEREGVTKSVTSFAAAAAPHVPELLGGGKVAWNGKIFPMNDPALAGQLSWSGNMSLDEKHMRSMETTLHLKNEPVHDMQPFNVLLHELIHGTIPEGEDYRDGSTAYQDKRVANIEEGFTELGTTQHMADFTRKIGVGSRDTDERNGWDPNPKYTKAVTALVKDLQAHWAKLSDRPGLQNQYAADKLGKAIEELKRRPESLQMDSGLDTAMRAVDHLGDPELSAWVQKTMSGHWEWNKPDVPKGSVWKADHLPLHQVATFAEYADQVNNPGRIHDEDAWGHYPAETARAQTWVQDIAHLEGLGDLTTPEGKKRVQELSDEINRQGAQGKVHVMAEQLIRANKTGSVTDQGEGSHGGFRHTSGILNSNQWYEVEMAIMDGFAPSTSNDHGPMTKGLQALNTAAARREGIIAKRASLGLPVGANWNYP
ncbi:MAG TPA: ParB N-terminal domain-containing protein [Streptosporangiaceae bacterium]